MWSSSAARWPTRGGPSAGIRCAAHAELAEPAARLRLRRATIPTASARCPRPSRSSSAMRDADLGAGADPHHGHLGAAQRTTATRSPPTRAPGSARRSCSPPERATSRRCRRSPRRCRPAIATLTPMQYRNPDQLEDGRRAGRRRLGHRRRRSPTRSSAPGRPVTLAVGEHVRVPRIYRGRDIQWWMDAAGVLDERYDEVDDIVRAPQRAVAAARGLRRPPHDRSQLADRASA